jgi:hypothetical protein
LGKGWQAGKGDVSHHQPKGKTMPTTRIADLIAIASALSRVRAVDIKGPRRNRVFVRVRQAVCYVAQKQGVHSYPQIGRALGGRDHSTVIHGARQAEIIAQRDPEYRKFLADIEAQALAAEPWLYDWEPPKVWAARVVVNMVLTPLVAKPDGEPLYYGGGYSMNREAAA